MKVYNRTENGVTTTVSQREGLDEINTAMMHSRPVRSMSSINRTDYAIEYRAGNKVTLRLVDESAPVANVEQGPKAWTGEDTIIVTVKGKRYAAGLLLLGPNGSYSHYWSERNGKTVGATRNAYAGSKPGSVAHAIWTAVTA